MAGIYIHIPFCKSRCIYCGFYSTTSLSRRQDYVDALCCEMVIRGEKSELRDNRMLTNRERVDTIYLGGGTPSQLTIEQFRQIFDSLLLYINNVYPLTPHLSPSEQEITIEVNPDDVTEAFAEGLCTLPINRVSMGVQTFSDKRLRFLHRRHTASQVNEAINRLRDVGIRNISIDLMYGFPGETLPDWQHDIACALNLGVEHISAYCLTIEDGTPLHKMYSHDSHLPPLTSEELERSMYEILIDTLEAAGYEHYEISNFALPSYRSRHNSSYWNDTPYIGFGAAAHSYDGYTRSWNIDNIDKYIVAMSKGERLFESETIDDDTHYNDLVTVALRTREGLNLESLSKKYRDYAINNASRYISDGLLQITPSNHLVLTRRGLFVSDMIMSEMIYLI